jgi:hypothetical protein
MTIDLFQMLHRNVRLRRHLHRLWRRHPLRWQAGARKEDPQVSRCFYFPGLQMFSCEKKGKMQFTIS